MRHPERVTATTPAPASPGALDELERLRGALAATELPLDLDGAAEARAQRTAALQQIDDYLAPRLANLDAPLLAVVGGSTGAGKSTIVNALVGHPVTRTGAIRPTTRQPILLHSPGDREWFASERILPGLSRITGTRTDAPVRSDAAGAAPDAALIGSVVLVADETVPAGLAVLDAPDVDSIADENRALAAQLLAAADLWCFVTTANRYADAVPWRLLDDAAARDITVAVVLNRVPPGAGAEVEADLRRMLAERGLPGAPVFTLHEQPLDEFGMLPADGVAPLRHWLGALAADRQARHEVARRTVAGAVRRLGGTAFAVAAARDAQLVAARGLAAIARDEYDEAAEAVEAATRDGALLRGEVLARWQDFVGTADVFRSMESWFGRFRDRLGEWFSGKPAPVREVETEIETGLHAVIVNEAGRAASAAWQRLRTTPAGRRLIDEPALARESADLDERAAALVREWQGALMRLIQEQAGGKRVKARVLSLGLNAVTVTLMIVVFASTAGLTGGEIAIAGGSAVVGQKLLETIFGDEAVRSLAKQARDDLHARVGALLDEEYRRYAARIEPVLDGPDGVGLVEAAGALERAMGGAR
ncbi:MAG: ABC transporter [Microbacteriaceae bacterium]|nr:ABC transporter [Microbacteriaceae bacterium]